VTAIFYALGCIRYQEIHDGTKNRKMHGVEAAFALDTAVLVALRCFGLGSHFGFVAVL